MPKQKIDIKTAKQVHGKIENATISKLDQILGDDGYNKYNTFNREEYELKLRGMNTAELRTHASKLGVMPIANRERLMKRLLVEFAKHVAIYKGSVETSAKNTVPVIGSNKKLSEAAIKIMSECK